AAAGCAHSGTAESWASCSRSSEACPPARRGGTLAARPGLVDRQFVDQLETVDLIHLLTHVPERKFHQGRKRGGVVGADRRPKDADVRMPPRPLHDFSED